MSELERELPGPTPATTDDPTHSPDGVDLMLIRWMLSLSPAERLRAAQSMARAIVRIRGAGVRT